MSRTPSLSTTSYALLGLLAVKPWTTYELTQQMGRSLGRMWPRAESKLYEEPKKLVAHGLARAAKETVGGRVRTAYTITPKGRRALAAWLRKGAEGPVLEFEQLVKVFFGDHGTKADVVTHLRAAQAWARADIGEHLAAARAYLDGTGPFQERAAVLAVTGRFLAELALTVDLWATWALGVVEAWPDDPGAASLDRALLAELVRKLEGRVNDNSRSSTPNAGP